MTFNFAGVVHQEWLLAGSTLGADKTSGKTGVEHDNMDIGRNPRERFLEFRIREGFSAHEQGCFIRMAGIIDDELGAAGLAFPLGNSFGKQIKCFVDLPSSRIGKNDTVPVLNAPNFLKGLGQPFRVADCVAKLLPSFTAVIGCNVQRKALNGERFGILRSLGKCKKRCKCP